LRKAFSLGMLDSKGTLPLVAKYYCCQSMSLNNRFLWGIYTVFLTGLLTGLTGLNSMIRPAMGLPDDESLMPGCKPKLAKTHACLEAMPLYSYNLPLSSDYSGELCVGLGAWEGQNAVVLEWDGLQTQLELVGQPGVKQLLQPAKRKGRSSGIVIYSDQPIMPQLLEQGCGKLEANHQITAVNWRQTVADELNSAQAAINLGDHLGL
jgi:hypothetical protein